MNPKLDPIITRKLDDFRVRRRNLILLRGLCSGVLSFLATFVLIALLDYFSEARITNEIRSGLSIAGYVFVFGMIWQTCIRTLLKLPSSKKLAQLLEQSSPDLQEDLLSAVELGIPNQITEDSSVFRDLVQKQASSKASKIDIKSILPLGSIKTWLIGTFGLIILTLALLQIPEFGRDLKLLMQRALLPGANLPPVTHFEVRVLAPDENTTNTPSNEPLRFVASVKAKRTGLTFDEISLETRTVNEQETTNLVKREEGRFFVDFNVGNQNFQYRLLLDRAPQTEWRDMSVGPRPFIESYQKNFNYPAYSELQPLQLTEQHGDLEAWEGTEIELSMNLNQPVKSGELEIQWTGKSSEVQELIPEENESLLKTTIQMTHPGTYRLKNLVGKKLGWKGRPTSNFEISVVPDLAPSIQWVEPQDRSLLVAPNDLLSFTAIAKDDLGLARIEYLIRKNKNKWSSFPVPELRDPRGQNTAALEFELDLLTHKLKPGTQAFLKLRAIDLKGTKAETEVIQFSIVSRDFDLSQINLLEKKSSIKDFMVEINKETAEAQKGLQEIIRNFKQQQIGKDALIEKVGQTEAELFIVLEQAYLATLQSLLAMPRGTDSYEVSICANAIGQIFLNSTKSFSNAMNEISRETDPNQIQRLLTSRISPIVSKRRGKSGNFKNLVQDLLNQHAETIAVSFLYSMHQRQLELGKSLQEKKSIPFLSRRQEVALNQWEPISKALSYSRDWSNASVIKRTKTSQLKLLDSLGKVSTDRNELRQQIESWEKNIRQVLRETEQKLASKHNQSIQKNRTEQLYWNLTRNDLIWDDTGKKWKFLEQVKPEKTILVWHDLLGQIDVLISDTMLMSEVEQAKKDQNSLFVKDAGQCGRALIQIQQEVRETDLNASENWVALSSKSSKLRSAFQVLLLQHHLIGSANQVIYFMREENSKSSAWRGAECARQWNRSEAAWKPILEMMHRERVSPEAIELMKKLPGQNYTKTLTREMKRRANSMKHDHQWTLQEADLVFRDLQKIISLIKDDVLEARSFVNLIAPTLPELARELARETKEQKDKVEEAKDEESLSLVEKIETFEEIQAKQEEIGRSVENFAVALRQEANIQNLLDDEGREIARDSDGAAKLIQEREAVIEENLQKSAAAHNSEELIVASEDAIMEQEKLIEDLNLIAEHFEKVNENQAVSETRDKLRDLEEELSNAEDIEEQYEQAERLANLAHLSPEELLEELEEELDQNQAMQRELSDIAQTTVDEAKEQLEEAKEKEDKLVEQIESEDQEIQDKKAELAKELKELAKDSEKLAQQKIDSLEEKAEQSKSESISDETAALSDELKEHSKDVQEAVNKKPDTQELREVALDLAETLENASEDLEIIAKDLAAQADLSPDQAQQMAEEAQQMAKKNQEEAESAQKDAEQKKDKALNAQQEALQKKIDERLAKEAFEEAKQKANDAKDLAKKSPGDPSLQETQLKAEGELTEKLEDLLEAQKLASQAEQQAENLKETAQATEAEVDQAEKIAEIQQNETLEASLLAEALKDKSLQESITEASQQGAEIAQEASEQAQDLQEKIEKIAEALDQLSESAKGSSDLLAEAMKTQEELGQETFETSQELAQAARHEERLENLEVSEILEELAESTEETAVGELPKTAQALENQALANQLENLAEAAENLSTELLAGDPVGDENIAEELGNQAEETTELLDNNPSFSDLEEQTSKFSEQAKVAEADLAELAENLAVQAEAAEQVAETAKKDAELAKAEMIQAKAEAEKSAQNGETSDNSPQVTAEDKASAKEDSEETEQLATSAEAASENYAEARELAQAEQANAQQATDAAMQASLQADSASEIAQAAEALLEQFSEPPTFAELGDDQLPTAGIALNDASNSFEEQLEALENIQAGEPQRIDQSLSETEGKEIPPVEFPIPSSEDSPSTTSLHESSTPFSDPEVSEVLAQALDSLDEAVFGAANPFAEPTENFMPEALSNNESGQAGQSSEDPINEFSDPASTSDDPGEPKAGNGPGAGGAGTLTSMTQANHAIAQALQSLQHATQAHAQTMAQQRSFITRSMDAKGNQLNSSDGQYQPTPVLEFGELPLIDEKDNEEDWGKLPPKLAKDLMEAKREKVSENYRGQVQAYFQAMSAKARTNKK
jgi:hypothetical protein